MKLKSNKAITLVALIITIIILLILAGVTLSMVLGNNGLINKAQSSVDKYQESAKQEKSFLEDVEDLMYESQTNIVVDKVTDSNPGVLEKEDENTFVINSIEDLVVFSYNVRSGTTYKDKTVKLGTDLDFASNKSYVDAYRTDYAQFGYDGELKNLLTSGQGFIPIGEQAFNLVANDIQLLHDHSFSGTFNGNGYKVYNLKVNQKISEAEDDIWRTIGFFATNVGTIQNVKLENADVYGELNIKRFAGIGGIVSNNSGTVENCYITGKVEANINGFFCNVGGVVASNARHSKKLL